jgi:hypothetical protein
MSLLILYTWYIPINIIAGMNQKARWPIKHTGLPDSRCAGVVPGRRSFGRTQYRVSAIAGAGISNNCDDLVVTFASSRKKEGKN